MYAGIKIKPPVKKATAINKENTIVTILLFVTIRPIVQ